MRVTAIAKCLGLVVALGIVAPLLAQDYSVLRINEVIADNSRDGLASDSEPFDAGGGTPDIVELYNTGNVDLQIGVPGQHLGSLALTDRESFLPPQIGMADPYVFSSGSNNIVIRAGEGLLIFCDGNATENDCEPHATFDINSDGEEPITLWIVTEVDGDNRPIAGQIIDQVWLPPLRSDVSFGRFPDGAGPAPLPVEDTFDFMVFNPPGETTFGTCSLLPINCAGDLRKRRCEGDTNGPGGNLDPRVSRAFESTNNPAAGEPVDFVLRVRDDKEPTPGNIASVEIVYTVNGGSEQSVLCDYDLVTGVQDGGDDVPPRPLDRWTLWTGTIPGQASGSRVEFFFRATDQDGLSSTRPIVLCEESQGPCDRDFGGPDCDMDPLDPEGERFIECDKPFTYAVDYEPRGDLADIVINEVMAQQATVLRDPSATDTSLCGGNPDNRPKYCCTSEDPVTCGYDDWVEFHNTGAKSVDVSGLWLSDRFFEPRIWQFPAGSVIPPNTRFLVWLDDDGSKCPDPGATEKPGFWECPDPNNPAELQFHSNFEINAGGDQVFFFDNEANGFGLIHFVDFDDQTVDDSLSLCPDGQRSGRFVVTADGTEAGPTPVRLPDRSGENACPGGGFVRGDPNSSGMIDLTDGINVLDFLFRGRQLSCLDAADTDDNGAIQLTDGVRIFRWLFSTGAPPAPPAPTGSNYVPTDCGPDPTDNDPMDCAAASQKCM